MLKDLVRLPAWALYILIVTTAVMSIVILTKIWVPELLDDTIFLKVILTYLVVIASSAIIAKIAEYIKEMER
jgi:hypothetical protein